MLYLKESIDVAAKQAREDAKQRKAEMRQRDLDTKNAYGRDMNGRQSLPLSLRLRPQAVKRSPRRTRNRSLYEDLEGMP